MKVRRLLLASWKFVLSFRKPKWSLEEYPVSIVRQDVPPNNESLPEWRRTPQFRAEIVNWAQVSGTGNTSEEAIRKLEVVFSSKLAQGDTMPRPGRLVPIEVRFADRERIAENETLAEEFTREVLGNERAWISDESSLWDFTCEDSLNSCFEKIRKIYGVDVSEAASGNIAEILEIIASSREMNRQAGEQPS